MIGAPTTFLHLILAQAPLPDSDVDEGLRAHSHVRIALRQRSAALSGSAYRIGSVGGHRHS
jgi:hypothetical protein